MTTILEGSLLDEQIKLEREAVQAGVVRYRELAQQAIERGDGANLKPAERLLLHWYEPFRQAIIDERRSAARRSYARAWDALITAVESERTAVTAMHEIVGMCMADEKGVPMAKLTYAVGRAVLAEVMMDVLKAEHKDAVKELDKRFKRLTPKGVNWFAFRTLEEPAHYRITCARTGEWLVRTLMQCASAGDYMEDEFIPAFRHYMQHKGHKKVGHVKLTETAMNIIDRGHEVRSIMRPRYLPMIVRPYRWSDDAEGGYVSIRTPFISKPTPEQKEALAEADLNEVWDCLDAVTGTALTTLKPVADVAERLWEEGGGVADIPMSRDIEFAPKPDMSDPEKKKEWKRSAAQTYTDNRRLKGARKEFLRKLDIAKRFAGRDIYFPHQLDFRGRIYPIPQPLHVQGEDLCRGLLTFGTPKPIAEVGWKWLKIEAASQFGLDKAPYDARANWTTANMATILDVAADPAKCRWWLEAENPWQFLQACLAIADPDGIGAVAPVRMDGSCNGLQHYAALSRNERDAKLVNLLPGDAPESVYYAVEDAVRPLLEQDAQRGAEHAEALLEILDAKLIKPPVMTSVYGVTLSGAAAQILTGLEKRGYDKESSWKAAMYLAQQVNVAIGVVCAGARETMSWLEECAKLVCKEGQPMRWTTPLGFPVVQPYRNRRRVWVKTVTQEMYLRVDDSTLPIKAGKQRQGFAPNFIHSLDATHMFRTARSAADRGVGAAFVHDSYWTRAEDREEMSRVVREEFVNLHAEDRLEQLRAQLQYAGADLPEPPARGKLNLNDVLDSPYFFH